MAVAEVRATAAVLAVATAAVGVAVGAVAEAMQM